MTAESPSPDALRREVTVGTTECATIGNCFLMAPKMKAPSGRRLGRSYKVKLWPTLIFLKDGVEAARLVRPGDPREIEVEAHAE